MEDYSLNIKTPSVGGYLSSEQIDLLSIIQCKTPEELILFINECEQINHLTKDITGINKDNLEEIKEKIFKLYQSTMVNHNSNYHIDLINRLINSGIREEDIGTIISNQKEAKDYIKGKYTNYEEIFEKAHHFISLERDQNKSEDLYEELKILNENLSNFDTILIGSGKISNVYNELSDNNKFDFYHVKRDLDFAWRNGKQVRYHSLLVKDCDNLFKGKDKKEILNTIRDYVKESIDFINEYNRTHRISNYGENLPVINAVDLFNEIISFEKNEKGEYTNIWEDKYGITLEELLPVFDSALQNKPKGVNYLYNEPFLEDEDRRKKVIETLETINSIKPKLIDTLGSQMHITITANEDDIRKCFEDFKKLQDRYNINIQITEFDMSLGRHEIPRVFSINGSIPDYSLEQVYNLKEQKIESISNIIQQSKVELSGVSYWSLTDGIDCNTERLRDEFLAEGSINDIDEIKTACGGLFPTYRKHILNNEIQQMMEEHEKDEKTNIEKIVSY